MANGIIPDPHVAMQEMGVQWVDEENWSYRTQFAWASQADKPNRRLRFEGLDTICAISLNGKEIASHDNMFTELEVDVTDLLLEGNNELRVDFYSAVTVPAERRDRYFEQVGLTTDSVIHFEERSFVRKAQYMYGWDWGPRLVSAGIWRPVSLIEYSSRITDVHVVTTPRGLILKSTTEGEGRIVHLLEGAGHRTVLLDGDGEHGVENFELWSPEHPHLYNLRTLLLTEAAYATLIEGWDKLGDEISVDSLDEKSQRIGWSQNRLLREADQWGESFEFEVNGRKIWARGANWIPDHSFPSLVTRERYRDRLEKCKDMGFNMLRVWGGGLYETDDFYDICDELGILVWQDFPFACAYYPDDAAMQAVVKVEAEANIVRLRNHVSLALWCGNNENLEMFINRWDGDKTPPRYYGENLYNDTLPAAVAALDPGRSYIATSPIGEPPAGTEANNEKQRGPNAGGYGDQHCWDVWHGRGDWKHYADSTGRFSSEYGFASSCSLSTWQTYLSSAETPSVEQTPVTINYKDPVVRWHDKTGKGYDTYVGYTELHYPVSQTLADWVYYSQLNQRDALRFGVEHYRRAEFCRGSLIWQINDCWPVQSWAILDFEGEYKALAYELRRLYADHLVSLVRRNEIVEVWVLNDGSSHWSGNVTVTAHHLTDGSELRQETFGFSLDADSRQKVGEYNVAGLATPDTLVYAEADSGPTAWHLLAEPKLARHADVTPIRVSFSREGELVIETFAPVVDLVLTENGSPAPFLDNVLTIPTAGYISLDIAYRPSVIEARSLSGVHPVEWVRGPL
jgi:beta-mannosidase